eukprot:scaffold195074_cov32-Tisochrysis_lutea.AAC.7
MVGSTSQKLHGVVDRLPDCVTPGHRTIEGDRTPPSYKERLYPRSPPDEEKKSTEWPPSLCGPLSDANHTTVLLLSSSRSSSRRISPILASRYDTEAAWSRSTSGHDNSAAYCKSDGTGLPSSGARGQLPQPPAWGTVYERYRKKGFDAVRPVSSQRSAAAVKMSVV